MATEKQLIKWRKASKNYRMKYPELTRQKCREYKARNPDVVTKNHLDYLIKTSNMTGKRTYEYRRAITSWSRTIRKRDKSCVICGNTKGLESHHILHRYLYPKLSLNISNGLLLCKQHHYEVHGKLLI